VGGATPSARLARLVARDFRNLAHVELAPPSEGLVVFGENGQGKTNLLEAIYYLEILRSMRGARDQDLVRFGADAFHIAAEVETDRRHEIGVGFERAGKRKRVRLDGDIPERLSDALGTLPSVMFSPADVELIAGAPAARRRYLDIMLALTTRGYLSALQRYRAALTRRNAALREATKAGRTSTSSVAVWEPPLAEHGATLIRERTAWVGEMAARFELLCTEIGEATAVRMRYASGIDAGDDLTAALAAALEEKRNIDLRRGLTHAGPHRDDLMVSLAGIDGVSRDLRTFGSAGQQRSAVIALRMLEAATFTERMGRTPVFLLDDPFAELDARRSANVLGLLTRAGMGQTILVVPRESDIPTQFNELERALVVQGAITGVEA
jgi:DNA replication and repair protein RecF